MMEREADKLMIIVWKWRDFDIKGGISEKVLDKHAKYINNIAHGKGKYYEEYRVEKSDATKNGRILAININNDGERCWKLLVTLVEVYSKKADEVLVFLHKAQFYDIKDVDKLLKNSNLNIHKCFLFGSGVDYIYYDFQQEGLLDDVGRFYKRPNKNKPEEDVRILNSIKSELTYDINQPHFDRVWSYYQHELERKMFELKEDVCKALTPLMFPNKPKLLVVEEIHEAINKSKKCLIFRLKDFIGYYDDKAQILNEDIARNFDDIGELEDEIKQLQKFEEASKQSYVFDDWMANLEHVERDKEKLKKLKEDYQKVATIMYQLLHPSESHISKQHIRELSCRMERLAISMPGEMNNSHQLHCQ